MCQVYIQIFFIMLTIFLLATLASVGATIITNPFETIKTRMQLHGESIKKGHSTYWSIARDMFKYEGIFAFQKGLAPLVIANAVTFGLRLACYNYAHNHNYISNNDETVILHRAVILYGICGAVSQTITSPFNLIKSLIQVQGMKSISFEHRTSAHDSKAAVNYILKAYGWRGLFRGVSGTAPRGFVASTSQIWSYYVCKDALNTFGIYHESELKSSILSALVGGIASTIIAAPLDLVMIRLYNQPTFTFGRGMLYKGFFDCIKKIHKTEGTCAFYNGAFMMYLKIGPTAALSLLCWDFFNDRFDGVFKYSKSTPPTIVFIN